MYQALTKVLGTAGDDRKVTLLYGNKDADSILLHSELDRWAKAHPQQLKVVHVLGTEAGAAAPSGWENTDTYVAETGWIDRAKIEKYAYPPAKDTMVFVCGVPQMYEALCGPRTEKELAEGSVLATLGYDSTMVAKM
jgi:cytochrome-b5 reductase